MFGTRGFLAIGLSGLFTACGGNGRIPLYVQVVRVADSNGTNLTAMDTATAQAMLDDANLIYGPDAAIEFRLAGISQVNSTLLNQLSAEQNGTCKQTTLDSKAAAMTEATKAQYTGKIVAFFHSFQWDEDCVKQNVSGGGGGFSSGTSPYISMTPFPRPGLFAHEVGHYLGLSHTFGPQPKTEDAARTAINQYLASEWQSGNTSADGRNAFNGDGLTSTPPDGSGAIFLALTGATNTCDTSVSSYTVSSQIPFYNYTYTFTPDRQNIMSYFWCRNMAAARPTLTREQMDIVWISMWTTRIDLLDYRPPVDPTAPSPATNVTLKRTGAPARQPSFLAEAAPGVSLRTLKLNRTTLKSVLKNTCTNYLTLHPELLKPATPATRVTKLSRAKAGSECTTRIAEMTRMMAMKRPVHQARTCATPADTSAVRVLTIRRFN